MASLVDCKHTANAATTRNAKHSESVGMADFSGVFLLSIIVFSCGETQKILFRKQQVDSKIQIVDILKFL